jgi:hypothetical protein
VTYLGHFFNILSSVFGLFYDVAVTPVLAILEYITSPFPRIRYVFLAFFSLLLLPIWPCVAIWGLVVYFADFVVRFHILFYAWDAISLVISNFKFLSGWAKTLNQLAAGIWDTFRTKKTSTVGKKVSDLNKKQQ